MDEKSGCALIVIVVRVLAEPKLDFRGWVVMINWEIDSPKHLFTEIGLPWGGLCGMGDLGEENFLIFTLDYERK